MGMSPRCCPVNTWRKSIDMKKGPNLRRSLIQCSGGDEGDRTPDLLTASQALSQLSYAPVRRSTIRELGRRCKDNFGKTFADAGAASLPGRGRKRGNGQRSRAMALSARGGNAAALPSGALRTSRVPPTAASRLHSAFRHPPNGHPAGDGPIIGADRAPARPAISKLCRFTGLARGPEHAVIGKIKTAGRRLAHSVKCRVWTADSGPAP